MNKASRTMRKYKNSNNDKKMIATNILLKAVCLGEVVALLNIMKQAMIVNYL